MREDHPQCEPLRRYGVCAAAKALGVSRRTMYRWIRRYDNPIKLHASKATGKVFILGKDLNAFWAKEL